MRTSKEYIELLKEHVPELQERFGITSMRLFGSVARGDHH
jgi:predicted nucleotidyltransferase